MEDQKIGGLTITEKNREKTITINGDNFTVQIPTPGTKVLILTQIARVSGSQDIKSFSLEENEYIRKIVMLNNVISDSPAWWTGADNCLYEDLLEQLWQFYLKFEIEFQGFLKKNTNKGKLNKVGNDN